MMIVYSVTVSIDRAVESDWLEWMQAVHIPDVMKTGHFERHVMRRVLEPSGDEGRTSYNIEYICASRDSYERYRDGDAPALQRDHTERYKDRFSASRILYEVVKTP